MSNFFVLLFNHALNERYSTKFWPTLNLTIHVYDGWAIQPESLATLHSVSTGENLFFSFLIGFTYFVLPLEYFYLEIFNYAKILHFYKNISTLYSVINKDTQSVGNETIEKYWCFLSHNWHWRFIKYDIEGVFLKCAEILPARLVDNVED
jgi:hypothetical protein